MKFCANLNFLFKENNCKFLERYCFAISAGFKGIESGFFEEDVSLEEILKVKNQNNIEHVLLNISTEGSKDDQYGCAAKPNAEKLFEKNLRKSVKLAKELKCKRIHIMAGKFETKPNSDHYNAYINNLKFSAKLFESEGIIGVIEPINNHSLPGYYLNSYTQAVDILEKVGSTNLKLLVDIFHLQIIQGNIIYSLKELKPYIGHIQIAQVPHRHEPNVSGELDLKYILKILAEIGYNDWIGCEYIPQTNTLKSLSWIQEWGYNL